MAEPMYRTIAQDLLEKIKSGDVRPGDQLPTELELRDKYSASRNTIRDAVKWLATRGLVETKPGQGTFAAQRIQPFVTTLSADPKTGLSGVEGAGWLNEVRAGGRVPMHLFPEWRSGSRRAPSRTCSASQQVRRCSPGSKSSTSTGHRGRCRPRPTRWSSSSRAPPGS